MDKLTLEISHEGLSAAIQRIDDHLPVSRAGDLDPTVLEPRSGGRTRPRWLTAHRGSLDGEVQWDTCVEATLGIVAGDEKGLAGGLEGAVKGGEEGQRILCEDLRLGLLADF